MKTQKRLTLGAALLATLSGSGTSIKAYLDSKQDNHFKYVVAREVAVNESEVERIREDLDQLRESIVQLRLSVEHLTHGETVALTHLPDEVNDVKLDHVILMPPEALIQQKQQELFDIPIPDT